MNNINKFALSLLLSTSLIACSGKEDNSKVVATYVDGKVTEGEVYKYFQKAFETQEELKDKKFSDLPVAGQEALIRNYIWSKVLEKEAKTEGIEDSESFKEKLKALKMQLVQQELFERQVKKLVTDEAIESGYNQMVKNYVGKSEMQASHILVSTKQEAEDIVQKLNNGASFSELAKAYSMDPGSKDKGGSLGKFVQGKFDPDFEAKLAVMKKGDISEPVQTKFGWHIIKLEDKRPYNIPSKSEARQEVINNLNTEAINKLAGDLMSKADIKFSIEDKKLQSDDKSDSSSEKKDTTEPAADSAK